MQQRKNTVKSEEHKIDDDFFALAYMTTLKHGVSNDKNTNRTFSDIAAAYDSEDALHGLNSRGSDTRYKQDASRGATVEATPGSNG